jgi:4-amino-4-deoxy-L-arabinose transferase-like glycosyltransferase
MRWCILSLPTPRMESGLPLATILQRHAKSIAALILVAACFLFFFNLGAKPFWDYDEAIYAGVVKDTLQTGQNLTLHLGPNTWFEKPPLIFWLSMVFDALFRHPEFSYRLTAAIAGIISIILVMLIAYEIRRDILIACLAGLILLTTGAYIEAGRQFRLDVPAIAASLFSILCFLKAARAPMWLIGVGIGFGLGFMFKSVIGLLGLPFLFWWVVVHRDYKWLLTRYTALSVLAFFIVLLPWHLYETLRYGSEFWRAYLGFHVFQRFSSNILGGTISTAAFLEYFFQSAAPWTILFVAQCVWLLTRLKSISDATMKPIWVCALTAVSILGAFIASTSKTFYYLLPVLPFVALSLALGFPGLLSRTSKFRVSNNILAGIFVALTIFATWVTINIAFHKFAYFAVNDRIVQDEKNVADILAKSDVTELSVYHYDYWDTIKYYSGVQQFNGIEDDQVLDRPFYLIMGTQENLEFPPELAAHFTTEYKGPAVTLYRFTP